MAEGVKNTESDVAFSLSLILSSTTNIARIIFSVRISTLAHPLHSASPYFFPLTPLFYIFRRLTLYYPSYRSFKVARIRLLSLKFTKLKSLFRKFSFAAINLPPCCRTLASLFSFIYDRSLFQRFVYPQKRIILIRPIREVCACIFFYDTHFHFPLFQRLDISYLSDSGLALESLALARL